MRHIQPAKNHCLFTHVDEEWNHAADCCHYDHVDRCDDESHGSIVQRHGRLIVAGQLDLNDLVRWSSVDLQVGTPQWRSVVTKATHNVCANSELSSVTGSQDLSHEEP